MKRQAGFSLVELAVVVFIIGLIASMSFGAFKAQMINASIRATKTNQDTIRDAMVAYLGRTDDYHARTLILLRQMALRIAQHLAILPHSAPLPLD
jgi:prepilin-type N-terminal cleavage/methylation domain-containing protein